jgi:Ca-activated chloride channel family protein
MDEIQQQVTETFSYNPIPYKDIDPIFRFASSVIMFGSVLRSSSFVKEIGWGDVLFHASEAANPTDINQAQFVELVYKTKEFYTKKKKKNKN